MQILNKKICVIGLGYIGLPTASLLANRGYDVLGVDVSESVVKTINEGSIHIDEPDLDIMVRSAVTSGKLKASLRPETSDIFILAVPTPFKENHAPDLTYVEAATESIASVLKNGDLVILESTCPVGTTEFVQKKLSELNPSLKHLYVSHCPERVLPGKILKELVENDRVIGGIDPESTETTIAFYQTFVQGELFGTDAKTAEMCKLTENSFRDLNIAFANELSLIADQMGINVWELIRLANRHPRVNILQPGPGVGGHCIAVDPWFIVASAGDTAKLIRTARQVNDSKPARVIEWVRAAVQELQEAGNSQPTIGCFGLTFKANVDDIRESPSLQIVRELYQQNLASIRVCEPHLRSFEEFSLSSLEETLSQSDILLLLVDHKEFQQVPKERLEGKKIIDTRGVWQ